MLPEVFHFGEKSIRIVMIDGEPWWVAADVCETLGIKTEQTRRLDEDEKGLHLTQTPSGDQNMVIINEPGLYSLVMRSRKAEAKTFKRWVTHEVLPSIRKTGAYGIEKALNDPAQLRALLGGYAEKVQALNARVEEMKPKEQFHDAIGKAINSQSVQDVAKVLDWGPNKLFAYLRKEGFLKKDNLPYQEYLDRGYFKVVERVRYDKSNEPVTYCRTLVTGKGLQFLFLKIGRPLDLQLVTA